MTTEGEENGRPRRLVHFTPLRYPGGKAKLANFIKRIVEENRLEDGEYAEPYAGGAGVAIELLLHEYVRHIHINDISRPIVAFWTSILDDTEAFLRRVRNARVTSKTWRRQKNILMSPDDHDDFDLGFAAFFLNRTNRSGILNGGMIGGLNQDGPWKLDARFNKLDLMARIESIARLRRRISITRLDAVAFLKASVAKLPQNALIYLDPPYYKKGKELYYDYYKHGDHAAIAASTKTYLSNHSWIVSYDNELPIRRLYSGFRKITYQIGYSAREVKSGSEVMFFSPHLKIPPMVGSMRATSRTSA